MDSAAAHRTVGTPAQARRRLGPRAYTYLVPQGEACAVCGTVREGPNQEYLGWWWHSACRAATDPYGREQYQQAMR